jgi:hypothetical protein
MSKLVWEGVYPHYQDHQKVTTKESARFEVERNGPYVEARVEFKANRNAEEWPGPSWLGCEWIGDVKLSKYFDSMDEAKAGCVQLMEFLAALERV